MLSTRILCGSARPLLHSARPAALRRLVAAPPTPTPTPTRRRQLGAAASFATTARTSAVNPNSQQPASDSIKHMGQNAKEEVQGPSPPPLGRGDSLAHSSVGISPHLVRQASPAPSQRPSRERQTT